MVWNFAYGSNLHPDRVRSRAMFKPSRVERARLVDWRLAFNLSTGLPFAEPSMANIIPAAQREVHGLALEMTEAQLEALIRSEGGGRFYHCVELPLQTYAGDHIHARAFIARDEMVREEVPPSLRYMTLIRDGARAHALEDAYCAALDAHPTSPRSFLSAYVPYLFKLIEHPRAGRSHDVILSCVERIARLQARRSDRRGQKKR